MKKYSESIMISCWPCRRCSESFNEWLMWVWFDFKTWVRDKHSFVWGIDHFIRWRTPKLYRFSEYFISLLWYLPDWEIQQDENT